ncbi:MAG: DUF4157 domain-containing protein, partial [Bacteroidota bacterium]
MKGHPTPTTSTKQSSTTSFFDSKTSEGPFFESTEQSETPFFPIQTKLHIGQADDPQEREADAIADRVVQESKNGLSPEAPVPPSGKTQNSIQRKCAQCAAKEAMTNHVDRPVHLQRKPVFESNADPDLVQRKCASCGKEMSIQQKATQHQQTTPDIQSSLQDSKGKGSKLPEATRNNMESSIGGDFSQVQIHTDQKAAQMNQALGAQAFTHGSDIYFDKGKYDTQSDTGKHLLAHELTHTLQQGGSKTKIQKKPADHAKTSDGDGVKNRMQQKVRSEVGDDADFNKSPGQMTPEERQKANDIDQGKKQQQKGSIRAEGSAQPSVNRPAQEKPKIEQANEEGKKTMEAQPPTKDKGKTEKQVARANLGPSEAREQKALAAAAKANQIKMPERPPELPAPRIEVPKDSKGQKLSSDPNSDKTVRALHEIAKLFVENAYLLKKESATDAQQGAKMQAKLETSWAETSRVTAGASVMKEDLSAREDINNKEEEALTKVEADTAMVKAEAPKLISKSEEGQKESGGLVDETNEQQQQMKANKPKDADAAKDAEKQAADTNQSAQGAQQTDDAFGDTNKRATQYQQDAIEGTAKNQETKAKITANKQTAQQTAAELQRIDAHNKQSEAQLKALDHYPKLVEKQTQQRAQSGEELYRAAVSMNEELVDIQEEFLGNMEGLPGKAEAQKALKEKQAKKKPEPATEAQQKPEEKLVYQLGNMEEAEQNKALAGFDRPQLEQLKKTADQAPTQEEAEQGKGVIGKADKNTGRKKVDLMKAFSGDPKKAPPDPRQEQINQFEKTRTDRLGGVKHTADANFGFLSEKQKQMLGQKLAMQNAVSGLFNIDILQMGKGMIMGMINPVESLKGVIDGAGKMVSGFVNLFNAEAWKKDPLGNLIQSAAEIANGITGIFMSITGLATAITIIMVAITIASLGFAAPVTGPVISVMATIISTVGGWTVVAGLIALALNALAYIKNVHDAGVAQNTDQLLAESDQIKENMTDGFTAAMAVVGGKGDKMGAKQMKAKIKAAGGAENFARAMPGQFKSGVKGAATKTGQFLKAGARAGQRLTKKGLSSAKKGISRALQKTKNTLQDLGGGAKQKLKSFKERLKSKKTQGGSVDTPHGKFKTPKPGESLGNLNGKKVK